MRLHCKMWVSKQFLIKLGEALNEPKTGKNTLLEQVALVPRDVSTEMSISSLRELKRYYSKSTSQERTQ